jgi:hypothetical protein
MIAIAIMVLVTAALLSAGHCIGRREFRYLSPFEQMTGGMVALFVYALLVGATLFAAAVITAVILRVFQ